MPSYFIGTDANKIGDVQLDANGELKKLTTYPVTPNPDNLPGKSPGGISTQWLVHHPTLPLVLALTSYGNKQAAHLSCFRVDNTTSHDGNVSSLQKLEGVEGSTRGREAVHAVFSPHKHDAEQVALAVAHHNDQFVSFFTFSTKEMPTSFLNQPVKTLSLPELDKGSRNHLDPQSSSMGLAVPSSHHVVYDRLGKYMWIVDPNQSAIFTFACNPQTGLPVGDKPSSVFKCHTDTPTLSWFGSIVNNVIGLSCRPRRIALSPNGEYAFILYETRNTIQVYGVNPKTGAIDTDCLQEVNTLDPSFLKQPIVGLTLQASAEMVVKNNSLYVSNQGCVFGGILGQGENSIRVFGIKDGGRLALNPKRRVQCNGPVRHFCVSQKDGKEIIVAGTSHPGKSLQTFVRDMDRSLKEDKPNEFELVGQADVDVNVFCVLPAVGGCDHEATIPSTTNKVEGAEKRGSLIALLQEKHKLEEMQKEQIVDAISQMEEQAGLSFRHNDDDGVLVDTGPEGESIDA